MNIQSLSDWRIAIPDIPDPLTDEPVRCPNCGKRTLTMKQEGSAVFADCPNCGADVVRDHARAAWIAARDAGKNGAAPESTTVTTEGASIVSVVTISDVKTAKMPEKLAPEAYYGLPGRVMRTIGPHTESHHAGLLGAFLAAGGCLIGPRPYVERDAQRHACNEFFLLVGKTGSGRKGTASRRIDEFLKYIGSIDSTISLSHVMREGGEEEEEERVYGDIILRGLGSGEALVAALAEEQESGETDPRRLVFESEFARCLKAMARENSTLSEVIRAAWDAEAMESRTKGKVLKAAASHVAIMAHSTETDLKKHLAHEELFNGFANRFLFMATRRVQSLPFGGGAPALAPLVHDIREALDFRKRLMEVEFDADAAWLWQEVAEGGCGIYAALSATPPGLLGAVSDRAAAHVTRLALQYAVWDLARAIEVPHLLAALAVWDYSEKTCVALFGRSTGDRYADTILEKIAEVYPGWLTRAEIRDLFARNADPGRIPAALEMLAERGLIERRKEPGEGRYPEIIVLSHANPYDRYDISPLEIARERAKERGYTTDTTED